MRTKRLMSLPAVCVCTVLGMAVSLGVCRAEKPPVVQFINIAPLPGAGLALNSEGKVDGQGALQVNIPVAYTPGDDFVSLSAYAGEYYQSTYKGSETNGSGVLAFGFGKWPRVYGSGMAVSSWLTNDSKAVSGQMQVVQETKKSPAIALGAQDILNKEEKDYGDVANTGVSYFAVATKSFAVQQRNLYCTLGYGRGRFLNNVFWGVSTPLSNQFSLAVENDGYQYNAGLAWRPQGRYSPITVLAGYNGEAGLLVGAQITGKVDNMWAIPAFLLMQRR